MLQRMLMKRGFLDASANQVPAAVLARRYASRQFDTVDESLEAAASATIAPGVAPSAQSAEQACYTG